MVVPGILYYNDPLQLDLRKKNTEDKKEPIEALLILGTSLEIPAFKNIIETYCIIHPKARVILVDRNNLSVHQNVHPDQVHLKGDVDDFFRFFFQEN